MTLDEVRAKYLGYFKNKGHQIVPSASLVPENDPTTLFTGSGMQPMLRYFLGVPHPLGKRIADSQKSFRAQDIEEVGDNRHTTFFEMLGNWSFGDYFKDEQIPWMFEFLTKELALDPKRLYFTCYAGNEHLGIPRDTESASLWQEVFKEVGIDASIGEQPEQNGIREGERIFYYGDKKNWWSRAGEPKNMPEGEPGGPDTEMFWDFGVDRKLHEQSEWKDEVCHVNCDCGRFMEIGNNVFMEYVKKNDAFEKLPKPNVDFGAGLERLSAATLDNPDVFFVSSFESARIALEQNANLLYADSFKEYRIVLDHIRGATFLIADGVIPGNTDRSYILRRLIRRAVLYADRLGIREATIGQSLPACFAAAYESAYPDLKDRLEEITRTINEEEQRFRKTLAAGLKRFEELKRAGNISGASIFDLYQTYGFPLEVVEELALASGMSIDKEAYTEAMERHREVSRDQSGKKFAGGLAGTSDIEVKYHTATHLLHRALREVLGEHVLQRGSNITPERLRFDFSHPQKMTPEEIKKVEEWVNEQIKADYPVTREEVPMKEARQRNAIGLFGEKYGDVVSIYRIGDNTRTASLEFCGGPHVTHTGVLGTFKIQKEEAVAAGVRRIKAVLS